MQLQISVLRRVREQLSNLEYLQTIVLESSNVGPTVIEPIIDALSATQGTREVLLQRRTYEDAHALALATKKGPVRSDIGPLAYLPVSPFWYEEEYSAKRQGWWAFTHHAPLPGGVDVADFVPHDRLSDEYWYALSAEDMLG